MPRLDYRSSSGLQFETRTLDGIRNIRDECCISCTWKIYNLELRVSLDLACKIIPAQGRQPCEFGASTRYGDVALGDWNRRCKVLADTDTYASRRQVTTEVIVHRSSFIRYNSKASMLSKFGTDDTSLLSREHPVATRRTRVACRSWRISLLNIPSPYSPIRI